MQSYVNFYFEIIIQKHKIFNNIQGNNTFHGKVMFLKFTSDLLEKSSKLLITLDLYNFVNLILIWDY